MKKMSIKLITFKKYIYLVQYNLMKKKYQNIYSITNTTKKKKTNAIKCYNGLNMNN